MPKLLADKLVDDFRRDCSRRPFFPGNILKTLASHSTADRDVTRRLWEVVPTDLRDQLTIALREAMSPEFQLPLWIRGLPKTTSELQADADLRTANLRAWAIEFCRAIDHPKL